MLTKVNELFHGQRRRGELGKPLHLSRYPKDGAAFQQKLTELHFHNRYKGSRLPPTRPRATTANASGPKTRRISLACCLQGSSETCAFQSGPSRAMCRMSFKIRPRLSDVQRRPTTPVVGRREWAGPRSDPPMREKRWERKHGLGTSSISLCYPTFQHVSALNSVTPSINLIRSLGIYYISKSAVVLTRSSRLHCLTLSFMSLGISYFARVYFYLWMLGWSFIPKRAVQLNYDRQYWPRCPF